jgi:hypothetical protein
MPLVAVELSATLLGGQGGANVCGATTPKIGDHGYGCHFEKDMGICVISTTITGTIVIFPSYIGL